MSDKKKEPIILDEAGPVASPQEHKRYEVPTYWVSDEPEDVDNGSRVLVVRATDYDTLCAERDALRAEKVGLCAELDETGTQFIEEFHARETAEARSLTQEEAQILYDFMRNEWTPRNKHEQFRAVFHKLQLMAYPPDGIRSEDNG